MSYITYSFIWFTRVYEEYPIYCQLYSFLFFWTFLSLIFIQVALAVNRWTLVCTEKFRFVLVVSCKQLIEICSV